MKVSIIIPVYNSGDLLSDTIDSVLNQTFRDLELICVDDGSTDGSRELLEAYKERDERVRIISQKNLGGNEARITGLNAAKGEYIYFCDHDDHMHPQLLEFCMQQLEEHHAEAIFFHSKPVLSPEGFHYDDLPPIEKLNIAVTDNVFGHLATKKPQIRIEVWAHLTTKEIEAEKCFNTGNRHTNWDGIVRMFAKIKRAVITDAKLYYYTAFNTSMSRQSIRPIVIRSFSETLCRAADFIINNPQKFTKQQKKDILKHIFAKNIKFQLNWIRRSQKQYPNFNADPCWDELYLELKALQERKFLVWSYVKLRHAIAYVWLLFIRRPRV